jgi:hypothetical protein
VLHYPTILYITTTSYQPHCPTVTGAPLPYYTQLYYYKLPAPLPHSASVRPSDITAAPGTISAVVVAVLAPPPKFMKVSGLILAEVW